MTIETDALRSDKVVAIYLTAVAMAQRQLTDTLSECVVTVDIVARFVADILVFSPGLTEEVVFDECMGRGEASSAQSYLN